jgi:pimeloyl-ACP methyl ester carboxylesterase
MAGAPSLADRLAEIRCPTLVMVGREDEPFLEPSRTMAEKIPDAELAILPGGAHQPQNECTEAWLTALRAHLQRARSA